MWLETYACLSNLKPECVTSLKKQTTFPMYPLEKILVHSDILTHSKSEQFDHLYFTELYWIKHRGSFTQQYWSPNLLLHKIGKKSKYLVNGPKNQISFISSCSSVSQGVMKRQLHLFWAGCSQVYDFFFF